MDGLPTTTSECCSPLKNRISIFAGPILHTAYLLVEPVIGQCGFCLYVSNAYVCVSFIGHKDTGFSQFLLVSAYRCMVTPLVHLFELFFVLYVS